MIISDLLKISHNQGSSCGDSSLVCHAVDDSFSVRSEDVSTSNDDCVTSYNMSPGGHKYYIPICGGDVSKPVVNQVFQSLNQGYMFYKEYGRMVGFDVRKAADKKDKKNELHTIKLKHYVCSKEGFNDVSVSEGSVCKGKRRRTSSVRCGCKAKLVLKLSINNSYFVFKFFEEHNHPLADESGRKFLRASRQMSISSRNFVFDAGKVNIGCSKSFTLLKEMVGGYANVGATLRDFRNFDRDLKAYVGGRDGQMIIDKFKVMHESSIYFYYAYELDEAGHLTKLFWADGVGRRNFDLYGDAISFDATFDTNKYDMYY